MRVLVLAILVLLPACASQRPEARLSVHKAELDSYTKCNLVKSSKLAKQKGDPVSLALAARGMCADKDAALSDAIGRNYRPEMVSKLLRVYRRNAIEFNTAQIAEVRAR